jgi:hypothetical protein
MRHNNFSSFLVAISTAAISIHSASAQQPAPTPKEIKIQAVTFEAGVLPGSNRQWIKVVTQFQSTPRWADGIVFSYAVLIGAGDQYRILPGTLRYANVKGGMNRAVMYISPNTAERFGTPLAAHVRAYYKDEIADDFVLKPAGNVPSSWETQYNKYQGLLLTVINTPWVISDYSNSPDIFATQ